MEVLKQIFVKKLKYIGNQNVSPKYYNTSWKYKFLYIMIICLKIILMNYVDIRTPTRYTLYLLHLHKYNNTVLDNM